MDYYHTEHMTSTYCCACGVRLLTAEEVGKVLNRSDPLTPASARREMSRTGMSEARGYPDDQVCTYLIGRPGRSRWGQK
jgi:hypothetical protein